MRALKNTFLFVAAIVMGACSSGDSVVVLGDFSVAYVDRSIGAVGNPTDGIRFVAGGDLFIKEVASPSASSSNITRRHTGGQGDVSDPEVSYDGERLLFAMRGPNDATWNLWEYDIAADRLTRIISDDAVADLGDDVDPAYLPDGRIVFSSNRQEKTRTAIGVSGDPYAYRDEYEREASIVLHVMDNDGTDIRQISFNQSHDRNPTVLQSGQIMFSRWDHVANNNHFPLFTTDPDGTNIFVQYGAFSPGNSFLHPREMEDGRVMSSLMPLSMTDEGGALMVIDVKNFSDNDEPATANPPTAQGQYQPTIDDITLGQEYSEKGRYTTPYPLWDGTNRALVSFKLNPDPDDAEQEENPLTGVDEAQENPPHYGIYMFDLDKQTLRPIAIAPSDRAYTDPIAIMSRAVPNIIPDKNLDGALKTAAMAILNVKSVYDTDDQDLMGDRMLVGSEVIPKVAGIPDIATLKDPALTVAAARPARFVRVTKAVPTPPGMSMDTIGEADFEMQQILGYAHVEPDGSFRIKVPADTPIGVTVLDANGRALQTHTNWIQGRPGETRTCNGCHSPRRGSAINSDPIAGNHPNTVAGLPAQSGESMAETRTRLDDTVLDLVNDIVYSDVWTDPGVRAPDAAFTIDYDAPLLALYSAKAAGDLGAGIINYPDHVQPIWDANCVGCHSGATPSADLDLASNLSGSGRLLSYDELLIGDPILENGRPVIVVNDDELQVRRETPLVNVGNSANSSRTSHLIEIIFNEELRAGPDLVAGGTDHSGMLSASAKRVITEWVDLGAQYYNDPFDDTQTPIGYRSLDEIRGRVAGLDEDVFAASVHPMLMASCAGCHQAFGNTGGVPDNNDPNAEFSVSPNRFVLTGNIDGDFNITQSMVNNVCDAANSDLALLPVSDSADTPPHGRDGAAPILQVGGTGHQIILDWINAAAAANACP